MNTYWKRYGGPGYALVERVEETIARYGMLSGGETVVVGVSGGPDSVCMLDVLARLGERYELNIIVAHVDHGLSADSADVAARVSKSAAEQGYDVHLARAPDLDGPNLHARARDFRYEFLQIVAQREEAELIATGHTLDDRVETTLARLIHGAGTEGLAGLPPKEGGRIRPLIACRRQETRAYSNECMLEFHDDPANEDLHFERPAVRAKVLAAIESHWGDGAVKSIARSSERLREDAIALAALAERLYPGLVTESEGGTRIELEQLMPLPRALRRRLLERVVGRIRDRSGGIEAVLDALESAPSSRAERRFAIASGFEMVLGDRDIVVSKLTSRDE